MGIVFRAPSLLFLLLANGGLLWAANARAVSTYRKIKRQLDAVPAIDTHDHLWPFPMLPGFVTTDRARGMNLASIRRSSYHSQVAKVTPWQSGGSFDAWWASARDDFDHTRATGFYRYQPVALQDLYGVDFVDYIMWRLCELNPRHDLQIHTGEVPIHCSSGSESVAASHWSRRCLPPPDNHDQHVSRNKK
jgi:hypothetical protein